MGRSGAWRHGADSMCPTSVAHGHEPSHGLCRRRADPGQLGLPTLRLPSNLDSTNPPPPPKIEPYKTHLAYVKERRTDKEAAAILSEALQALRDRRDRGEVIY